MPKVIPPHVALRTRLKDSVNDAVSLNGKLIPLVHIKPRTPAGIFHGKVDFSQPPWHSPVAMAVLDLHALSRKIEREMRYELGLPVRYRGSSDANTAKALEATVNLAEKADDYLVRLGTREIEKWSRRASIALGITEVPKRLPRAIGQTEPKCPFCHLRTLRSKALERQIKCVNPKCADDDGRKPVGTMEFSELVGDWVIVWMDGVVGVPL